MASPLEILNKLNKIDVSLSAQIAMEKTADAAAEAQRNQLRQGLRSDGTFQDDYSFRSVFQYGKPPGPILWFDTGSFYREIYIDVRQDIFIMESRDPKSTMIQNRGGVKTLGLGVGARIEYIRTLKPAFKNEIKSYLLE